jgi:Tol biopolymer transport system component
MAIAAPMLAAAGLACGADGPTPTGPGPVLPTPVPGPPDPPVPVPPVSLTNPRLAFTSNRDGTWRIYVANADGSGATPISDTPILRGNGPGWSPDGRQIVFSAYPPGLAGEGLLFTMSPAGSGLRSLSVRGTDPAWSPDGQRLVFASSTSWPHGIEVIEVDGSNRHRLHSSDDYTRQPAWSPDGQRIAFAVGTYVDHHTGIWIVNADGSGLRQLGPIDATRPVWSPDGTRIAYNTSTLGIRISHENGSGASTLVSGPDVALGDWSSDGQIVFSRYPLDSPPMSCRIYVIAASGGVERQLVPDVGSPASTYCDSQPVWARP